LLIQKKLFNMKRITLSLCAAALFFVACNNAATTDDAKKTDNTAAETTTPADVKTTTPPPAMPDSATMAKNWQAFMTPGAVHKMLAKGDGNWASDITMWMQPGAPEQKNKGTMVNKMIMNGLYQQSSFSGNMMGMPFNGISTTAYDVHRKEFVSTWIDNMGSGIMVLKGPWDEATKTMNLKGKMTDPGTTAEVDVRETMKLIDDNTQEMEMFIMMPDGKEFKTMNIKYSRKK
jgi:Protein of unknown function (DUF1579)